MRKFKFNIAFLKEKSKIKNKKRKFENFKWKN